MRTLEFVAVGDVSLACSGARDPFERIARYLRAGDIVFGNLESVLCEAGTAAEKEMTLRVSPRKAGYLRRAGFTILNVANNHALDYGSTGLNETLSVLREQGIRFVGCVGSPSETGGEIIECKGLRVGFLGYCEGAGAGEREMPPIYPIDRDLILEQLDNLRQYCDVAIVSLHWGIEYVYYPSPGHVELARDLIANGAGLVLGHHPHVVQGLEEFEKGLIVYSLGSFQFDPRRKEARHSFICRATLSAAGVERYKLLPVRIDDENMPRLVWKGGRKWMLEFVDRISAPIWEDRITERWWFEQIAVAYLRASLEAWVARVRKYGVRHFVPFIRWLVSRFTIKCYLGLLRSRAGLHE
jgi:poly-gamma-glutamate capsule biosynthesis protein CapA/YwtB (metallophosphatase superfamily)